MLRAGLLASLADGVLPGGEGWPIALLRPGEHPLRALDAATAAASPGDGLIVAVDQFEETFATCRDSIERSEFIHALVSFASGSRRRALVASPIRADFYVLCRHAELSRLLGAMQSWSARCAGASFERAIELPARRAGLQVEPELVVPDHRRRGRASRVRSVELAAGALAAPRRPPPANARLRARRRRAGAVARLAESAYERLGRTAYAASRRILLRLAGGGGRRRSGPTAGEVVGARPATATGVCRRSLGALAEERLITIGKGEVEVAHEALLREWRDCAAGSTRTPTDGGFIATLAPPRLNGPRAGAIPGSCIAVHVWRRHWEWADTHRGELNTSERAFLDASRAAGERSQRRLRARLAGVGALLVFAVIASVVALAERGNARDEALPRMRSGWALRPSSRTTSTARCCWHAGVELDDTVQTRGNLLAGLLEGPAAIGCCAATATA